MSGEGVVGRSFKGLVPEPLRRRFGPYAAALTGRGEIPLGRLLTAPMRVLPDFIIIGAAKSGTSTLFFALKNHPAVVPPITKEIHFFDHNYARGSLWYRAHFPSVADRRRGHRPPSPGFATGEATPYYLAHPQVPRRVAETVPHARLIALLRDPVDRAYSHYQHQVRARIETLSFEEALEAEEERVSKDLQRMRDDPTYLGGGHHTFGYMSSGLYAQQLEDWFRFVPRERVLVVSSDELFAETAAVFRRVIEHLGLPTWEPDRHVRRNVGGYETTIDPRTRERLAGFYEPHNHRLYTLIGRDLGWQRT